MNSNISKSPSASVFDANRFALFFCFALFVRSALFVHSSKLSSLARIPAIWTSTLDNSNVHCPGILPKSLSLRMGVILAQKSSTLLKHSTPPLGDPTFNCHQVVPKSMNREHGKNNFGPLSVSHFIVVVLPPTYSTCHDSLTPLTPLWVSQQT